MTDAQKIEKLRVLVAKRAKDGSQSHAVARELLVREGIYGSDGHIAAEYGGEPALSEPARS